MTKPEQAGGSDLDAGATRIETARFAGLLGLGFAAARGFGLIRDILIAGFLGTSHVADAWLVAFKIPNLLGYHLATGAFNPAFIPVLNQYLEQRGRVETRRLIGVTTTMFGSLLVAVTVVGVAAAPLIVKVIAPGFGEVPGKVALTVHLLRWCFVYLLLIGGSTLLIAVSHSLKQFVTPAIGPVVANVILILAVLFLCPLFGTEPELWVGGLVAGTVLAGLFQVLVHLPSLARRGMLARPTWDPRHPGLRRIMSLLPPTLVGVAVTQLTIIVNTALASLLESGSVAAFEYGVRAVYFPYAVSSGAVTAAILPMLSRQAAREDMGEFRVSFVLAVRCVVFVMIPVVVSLSVLALPIVRLLFERGAFDVSSSVLTASVVKFYAPMIVGESILRLTAVAFFSLQDTRTPVKIAALSLVLNVVLALTLMGPLRIGGIALAGAVAPVLSAVVAVVALRRRVGAARVEGWSRTLLAVLVGGGLTWVSVRWAHGVTGDWAGEIPILVERVLLVIGPAVVGILAYVGVAAMLRVRELAFGVRLLRHRSDARP